MYASDVDIPRVINRRLANEYIRKRDSATITELEQSDIRFGRRAINTIHRGMWWDTYDNVYVLAKVLHEAAQLIDAEDLLSYFEKPWRWEREWNLWNTWDKPQGYEDEGWQAFLDALDAPEGEEEAQTYYNNLDAQRNEER